MLKDIKRVSTNDFIAIKSIQGLGEEKRILTSQQPAMICQFSNY